MNHTPLISVLTVTFNAIDALRRTVESVAGQQFADFEHVIVDGGSTDGTQKYLEELPSHVRWISETDQGIGDALNKALALAHGKWLIVLHADDTFFSVNSLEYASLHLHEADIVGFDVMFTSSKGDRRLCSGGLSHRLLFKTTIPHQGAFISSALHERIGKYDASFRIVMDYEFFLRARSHGARSKEVHQLISYMPDTGVSSRRDWPSLRSRFAEEYKAHRKHAQSALMNAVYTVYQPLYLMYRWTRSALTL